MGTVDPLSPLVQWGMWMRAEGATDKTIQTRLGAIHALCGHAGVGELVLSELDIVAWLAGQRSAWTRRSYAVSARQWHRWLLQQGYRTDDPTARLRMPPQPRSVPRPASSKAIDAVLAGATRRVRAYVLLAAYEGLRCHEIARVRGADFDGDWMWVSGKGDTRDAVPVHPLVTQVRRGWPEEGWWFPGQTAAEHVRANSVSRAINQAIHRAGYPDTAHQLRHWFGTHTLRTSRDLRTTQDLLRHRSIASTQVYTQISGRAKQEAVNRLNHQTIRLRDIA